MLDYKTSKIQNVEIQNVDLHNVELQNFDLQNIELQNVENYKMSNLTERRNGRGTVEGWVCPMGPNTTFDRPPP
jgi:hypothetical protein